jgi:hypothetical protein
MEEMDERKRAPHDDFGVCGDLYHTGAGAHVSGGAAGVPGADGDVVGGGDDDASGLAGGGDGNGSGSAWYMDDVEELIRVQQLELARAIEIEEELSGGHGPSSSSASISTSLSSLVPLPSQHGSISMPGYNQQQQWCDRSGTVSSSSSISSISSTGSTGESDSDVEHCE